MDRPSLETTLEPLVELLYPTQHHTVRAALLDLAETWAERLAGRPVRRPDQSTAYLITYGDAIRRPGEAPLRTLGAVMREQVRDAVTDVHLLPMFPWTSDDGFAVVDHRAVNPDLGTWQDVAALGADHDLMFDFVANHVSSASPWFTGWLEGDPRYEGYFFEPEPDFDTARVVRPRTSRLVHRYQRPDGTEVGAWTTFGRDQVDVNIAQPAVLLDLTDVLLGYVDHGATTIRLDAIGFLWKQSGTPCLHLPQTHAVIKIWRALLDQIAPGVRLLTETNVPHEENISYFGDGTDEAHMVYQFALPPLVLHAFVSGQATTLAGWAQGIRQISDTATWFNFLASHDGIGLRPTEGILTDLDREALVERVLAHGGRVSMAARPDGSQRVYELNTSFLDALADPVEPNQDAAVVARGLAAHSILLSMVGIPAIYYHSLFGSTHDHDGMATSGINRRINRQVLDADELVRELTESPRRRAVFEGITHQLAVRRAHPAFSPSTAQEVQAHDPRVLVIRRAPGTPDEVVTAVNVSGDTVDVPGLAGLDVLTGVRHDRLHLVPYGHAWLRPDQ